VLLGASLAAVAQDLTVTGHVRLIGTATKTTHENLSGVVVWLVPASSTLPPDPGSPKAPASHLRLVQKNKSFQPHILVVPVGAAIEFPNLDPWFHNVFSLFEGKKFDLGLYEAGESRMVHFDREGISYIFCNIHPEMSAVVIALTTPYHAVSDRNGNVVLTHVPPGRYSLHLWSERALPEALQSVSRDVTISDAASSLGEIKLAVSSPVAPTHTNKYGREYDPHSGSDSPYRQP